MNGADLFAKLAALEPEPTPTPGGEPVPSSGTGETPTSAGDVLSGTLGNIVQQIREHPLATAGGVAGGLLSGGAGALAGGAAAFGGAAAGELTQMQLERGRGRNITDSEFIDRILGQGALAGVPEAGGRAVVGAVERAAAPGAGKLYTEMAPLANQVDESANPLAKYGLQSLDPKRATGTFPDEISYGWLPNFLKRAALNRTEGRDILLAADDARRASTVDALNADLVTDLARNLTPEEFAHLAAKDIAGNFDIAKQPATQIYEAIKSRVKGTETQVYEPVSGMQPGSATKQGRWVTKRVGESTVDNRSLMGTIQPVLATLDDTQGSTGYATLDVYLRKLKKTSTGPERFVGDVITDRTELRDILRGIKGLGEQTPEVKRALRNGKAVEDAMTGHIYESLERTAPDMAKWLQTADEIYGGAVETYRPRALARLVGLVDKDTPGVAEDFTGKILNPAPRRGQAAWGPQRLGILKTAMTDPTTGTAPAWDTFQQFYTRYLLDHSFDETGKLNGKTLAGLLSTESRTGRLQTILGDLPDTVNTLRVLSQNEQFIRTGGKSVVNPLFEVGKDAQGGITITARTTAATPTGLTIRAAERVLALPLSTKSVSTVAARLLTNPTTAKWLGQGFKTAVSNAGLTRANAGLAAKLIAAAQGEEQLAQAERAAYERSVSGANAVGSAVSTIPSMVGGMLQQGGRALQGSAF